MTSPIESANTPEDTTARTRPRIGRAPGSKNAAPQARALRTRDAIITVAARHFDTDGYGHTSMNTIAHAGRFAKGAMYYHFPSKEGIGNQLLSDWKRTVDETVTDSTASSSSTAAEKLTAIFTTLARQITEDINLRAGMKLTLEPSIDNTDGFAHWVDAISGIVDTAIAAGEIPDTPTTHRLAWNLCAGTVGAAHASASLGEDIDLVTRIGDTVAAHIESVSA
ncbi:MULTISPECIES: TetR/AcrR family transcriptional regulator [Rhodococcus erythropolis group]|uniref:TetR/AcrR family transcriptional regulator n=1 Tax=Rhodococcus erythropolis TaxID=1833 RepID=A0A8I1D823_RHOER|nr:MULTISPECIES: TetR/AcrR family transcriptional regulator [Rhodococcus erythropolis group]MBH5144284.1 TetR/AcrR family transcriptional regulator [Rhodococcus erythropolis]MDJ0434742.1 TetR/AcrR family transcriptional regulator [Rhodococcus qingshengii]QEM25682.1 TetR/AcrR family transcriptional regulator [Rhodococcus qingshengii]